MPEPKTAAPCSSSSPNDALLQRRVADRLHTASEVDTSSVSVVVRNRSATLVGTVASERDRAALQRLAIGISGLVEVNNRLKLRPSAH
jgi:osmotically-inducible protein OsmY